MHDTNEVLTVEQAAKVLSVCRATGYKLANNGGIPTIRVGRLLRVPRVQLERMLEGQRESSEESR